MLGTTTTKTTAGETCAVCEQVKGVGRHLYTTFICEECERDMIGTDTNDPSTNIT